MLILDVNNSTFTTIHEQILCLEAKTDNHFRLNRRRKSLETSTSSKNRFRKVYTFLHTFVLFQCEKL